jgi:DNA-binding transcriptional LysR family regulator
MSLVLVVDLRSERRAWSGVRHAGVEFTNRDGSYGLGAAHLHPQAGLQDGPLGEQELLFVLPPQKPPRASRPIQARELARIPLVVSPPGTSTGSLLEEALAKLGVIPRIAVETAAREAIVPLVLVGAGAALLPASLAEEARRRGAVVRVASPRITRPIGLIHRQAPLSTAAQTFLATVTLAT